MVKTFTSQANFCLHFFSYHIFYRERKRAVKSLLLSRSSLSVEEKWVQTHYILTLDRKCQWLAANGTIPGYFWQSATQTCSALWFHTVNHTITKSMTRWHFYGVIVHTQIQLRNRRKKWSRNSKFPSRPPLNPSKSELLTVTIKLW